MGQPAAAHVTSIAFDLLCAARPRARRPPLRRRTAGRGAAVRVGRLSVHPVRVELEHERRDHARVPHLRLLARLVGPLPRSIRRARAAGRSSLRCCSRRCGCPIRSAPLSGKARFAGGFAAATAAAFSILLLEPNPRTPRASSGTALSAGRSAATRRSRSGAGASTTPRGSGPRPPAAGRDRTARRRRESLSLRPPAEDGPSAAALTGANLIGFELRADALVRPVHPVVLRGSRLRGARGSPARRGAPRP